LARDSCTWELELSTVTSNSSTAPSAAVEEVEAPQQGGKGGGGVARQGALGLGDVCGHARESGILDRWVVAGAERRKERS
jgi:hypothetical protein